MKKQVIAQNKKNGYGNPMRPIFAGGYISSYVELNDKSFDSFDLSLDDEKVRIMIFHKSYKTDNPLIKILKDAYAKHIPIACVYYDSIDGNVLQYAYVNFSSSSSESRQEVIDLYIDEDEELPL